MSKFRLIFVVLFALFFASSVYAADIAVDADCSLADAIIAANRDRAEGDCPAGRGADTITLTQDITLRAELPAITSDITIEGNGYTISGNHRYRIFYNDGGALTINDLTMTKGYVEGDFIRNEDGTVKATTAQPFGGAIVNWQGTLSISDITFRDNLAESFGGAIFNVGELSISGSSFSDNWTNGLGGAINNWYEGELSISSSSVFSNNSAGFGGAISNRGELSIVNSTFNDNSAEYGDGAISNRGELSISSSIFSGNSAENGSGGAIGNGEEGELSITNSSFRDNSAENAKNGGAISNSGELNISNSTFSVNSADWGGAIVNWEEGELSVNGNSFSDNWAEYGGAIDNGGELSIVNSTFSGNSSKYGGGAISNGGELSIINSTFSDNSADKGGAIFNEEDGKLRMRNNIIASIGGACYSESRLRGNINNFIRDGSCSSDFSGNPKLGKRVEPEDGSPAYFPLLAGSPAIDAADVDDYCPATDQIGTERPQGPGCDIGAIEFVGSRE